MRGSCALASKEMPAPYEMPTDSTRLVFAGVCSSAQLTSVTSATVGGPAMSIPPAESQKPLLEYEITWNLAVASLAPWPTYSAFGMPQLDGITTSGNGPVPCPVGVSTTAPIAVPPAPGMR
jgi:hypothetical protein